MAVLLLTGTQAHAHGGALPLAEWGAFAPSAAYCQRIIGHAASRCTLRAAKARRDCLDATISGGTCDQVATDAEILAARRRALDEIDLHCSENNAQTLGYIGMFDLQADVIRFCREWEDLSAVAVYGPVLSAPLPADADTLRCVTAAAGTVAKLAELVFRTWRRALDRIAVRPFELSEKQDAIAFAGGRCVSIESRAAELITRRCGRETFETIYARTAGDFAHDLQLAASCFAPAFYIQDGTACAASSCGNGILEPTEGCDDGNREDGDGCSARCIVE